MSAAFDRDALLDAFDRIGRAAVEAGRSCKSRSTADRR
jgi:hypothetical protein